MRSWIRHKETCCQWRKWKFQKSWYFVPLIYWCMRCIYLCTSLALLSINAIFTLWNVPWNKNNTKLTTYITALYFTYKHPFYTLWKLNALCPFYPPTQSTIHSTWLLNIQTAVTLTPMNLHSRQLPEEPHSWDPGFSIYSIYMLATDF